MKFTSSTSSIHLLSVLASFTFLAQAQPLEKRLPNGPSGSRLVQFSPSSACQTSKTIPMFVNKAWSSDSSHPSQATHAIIVQHGLGRDVNNAFSDVYPVIGDQRVLVAPGFNLQSDSSNVSLAKLPELTRSGIVDKKLTLLFLLPFHLSLENTNGIPQMKT